MLNNDPTSRLHQAVAAVCPIVGVSVGRWDDLSTVRIDPDSAATPEEIAAAQAALPAAWLTAHKTAKCEQIDARTAALIGKGFTFDGQKFSLSATAQMNANTLDQVRESIPWPQPISTATGGEYSLTSAAHCRTFALAMMAAVKAHLDSGRALRLQVLACGSVAEIQAIQDNRS